jgi:rhamnogalacturonan endolyase
MPICFPGPSSSPSGSIHHPSFLAALGVGVMALFLSLSHVRANDLGGGNGQGPDVKVTDGGDTVTLSNGIASIEIVKGSGRLNELTYTYNNSGQSRTASILAGLGQYYYGGFSQGASGMVAGGLGSGHYVYSLAVDPASTGGNYGEVLLTSDSPTNGVSEYHYSMLRGSPGFYSTAIETHRSQDDAVSLNAWGLNSRVSTKYFNWLSANPIKSLFYADAATRGVGVPNSPHEITLSLDGPHAGEFVDKFFYGMDHGDRQAWGWSSVGPGGSNIGVWMMSNLEYSNGGPLKHDVSSYPANLLTNYMLSGEVGMGSDGNFAQGETWTKTCGPWLIYLNNIPASITDPGQAAHALFQDALAQDDAEKKAWPYPWFKNNGYVPADGRGIVQGKLAINDSGNPNASPAGVWIGIEQQPPTSTGIYDIQKWSKPYQFWVKAGPDGSFTLPHVLPGSNYTLWAFGPGAAGTFLSQNQKGQNPPLECDVPASPFAVTVTAGQTTQLGTVTWTPLRVGPTVFQLGFPTRIADKFRHGDDYFFPAAQPKLGYPTPFWGMQMMFPSEFPNGLNYTVGQNRWDTDWNYILPSLPDAKGIYQGTPGTITFNLAQAPSSNAQASIYIGAAGCDVAKPIEGTGNIVISVNDTDLTSAAGAQGSPDPLTPTGYDPPYSDDSSIHFSAHGPFSDERINFPGSLLRAGKNTITIHMNAKGMTHYFMVDYLRLELTGYVPVAPASVTAEAGQGRILVLWPVVPGATSYEVLRSTSPTTGFTSVASGLAGPVAGSDTSYATYIDATAANGTPYYYQVVSVNPVGKSNPSPSSAAATAALTLPSTPPAAPQGLAVTSSGDHHVSLTWNASPGANSYSVWRTTLYPDGVGGFCSLRTINLTDWTASTSFTDNSPSNGRTYSYFVKAANAAGDSSPTDAVRGAPLPAPPAAAPGDFTAKWTDSRQGRAVTLNWSPVPGAVGYVIYRSTTQGDFKFPDNFVTTLEETTYTDANRPPRKGQTTDDHLQSGQQYFYQVTAVNAGGISPPATADPNQN